MSDILHPQNFLMTSAERTRQLSQKGWKFTNELTVNTLDELTRSGKALYFDIGGDGQRAIKVLENDPNVFVITFTYNERDVFWGEHLKNVPNADAARHLFVVGDVTEKLLVLPVGSIQAKVELSSISNELMQNVSWETIDREFPWHKALRTNHNIENYYYENALISLLLTRLKIGSEVEIIEPETWLRKLSVDLFSGAPKADIPQIDISDIEWISNEVIIQQKRTRYLSVYQERNPTAVPMLKISRN